LLIPNPVMTHARRHKGLQEGVGAMVLKSLAVFAATCMPFFAHHACAREPMSTHVAIRMQESSIAKPAATSNTVVWSKSLPP
jgi:hypothetical protein